LKTVTGSPQFLSDLLAQFRCRRSKIDVFAGSMQYQIPNIRQQHRRPHQFLALVETIAK
jgi:hypothetical protein